MPYLELDDIIFSIQKFGGASTYWVEMTSRLHEYIPQPILHSKSSRIMRLFSPKSSAKIFHSSHFRVSSTKKTKNVVTIHDLIYEKGMAGGLGRMINLYERKKAVEQADAIICISNSTKSDLLEYYGKLVESKPIHVVYHGCNARKSNMVLDSSCNSKFDIGKLQIDAGNFFMFVGGRGGYKNFNIVLKAFAAGEFYRQGLKLICTGANFTKKEYKFISDLGLEHFVVSIGFVDTQMLSKLYSVSRGLIYPSLYEGFGLPPLEAMAMGCPVICSDSSSLPEVVGAAGLLFDGTSVEQLVELMQSLLFQDQRASLVHAGMLRAAEFNWNRTASMHANIYASLVE